MNRLNQKEFTLRIAERRGKMLQLARAMVRESDCEDAVQSAILSAWEHLPTLRDESAFDAWLKRILINRCRQIQRGYRKEKELYSALEDLEPKLNTGDSVLREAMEELSDAQRKLIRLHHEQGYSIKEVSAVTGKPEDVLKMRLYRARKRLRTILLALLLLVLLASAAIGTGMIDVSWFLQNRRAELREIENLLKPESARVDYGGEQLDVSVSDVVWNKDELTLTFVYSIAGRDPQALTVHGGNIGVDGLRMDHIWTNEGIVPVPEWANGKQVRVFSLDGWRLSGIYLTGTEDYLPDGLGETFMTELYLDGIAPDRYEGLLDEDGMLAFEAELTLMDYGSTKILEAQPIVVKVSAPSPQEWRDMYETYDR